MSVSLTRGKWKGAKVFSLRLKECRTDPRYEFSYENGFYGFVRNLGNEYAVHIEPKEYRYPEGKISVSLWHENSRIKLFPNVALSRITDTADALEKMVNDPMYYFARR